jgi:hypothetical protein
MASSGYPRPLDNPYAQRQGPSRGDYDSTPDLSDHYNNMNSSTARLAPSPGYYDQNNGRWQ